MKLSIIIPVYNEIKTIEKIIKKVRKQSIKNFEIIVVDDYSTDGTRELLKSNLKYKVQKILFHKEIKERVQQLLPLKNILGQYCNNPRC